MNLSGPQGLSQINFAIQNNTDLVHGREAGVVVYSLISNWIIFWKQSNLSQIDESRRFWISSNRRSRRSKTQYGSSRIEKGSSSLIKKSSAKERESNCSRSSRLHHLSIPILLNVWGRGHIGKNMLLLSVFLYISITLHCISGWLFQSVRAESCSASSYINDRTRARDFWRPAQSHFIWLLAWCLLFTCNFCRSHASCVHEMNNK